MRCVAVALLFVSALCPSLAAQAEPDRRPIGIADLIEVNAPSKVTISPDGRQVAYVLTTPSLADNALSSDLYVLATDGAGQPRKLASAGSTSSAFASVFRQALTWTPDSRSLVFASHRDGMSEIRTVDVGSGRSAVLVTPDMLEDGYEIQGAVGATFKFSPDGRRLAFVARRKPVSPAPEPKPMRAIDADEEWQPPEKRIQPDWIPVMNLFLLDLDSGQVTRLTNDDHDVASFDWSPDGTRLALSLKTDLTRVTSYYTTDIFVLDLSSRRLRPLVRQDGQDDTPLWSPDGRTIAFASQAGAENGTNSTTLALVASDGGSPPRYIGRKALDRWVSYGSPVRWSPDGRSLDVLVAHDLGRQLLRVDVGDGSVRRLTPRADRYYFEGQDDGVVYSADGQRSAFAVQGVGVPPEVAVADADFSDVRQLTDLNPDLQRVSLPLVERVKWRSRDDKWDLNGLLLKPSHYVEGRRYPMLTALQGGPSMVFQHFNPSFSYPLLLLAERGYVVFIPNTRGRPGYSMDFQHAIRDERSYVLNPLDDALSGIDLLLERGIADPDRLGVMGFSYGGTLTANIITHTNRFKAAIYGEGSPDIVGDALGVTREFRTLYRDLRGLGVIFEPEVFTTAVAESAMFRLDKVKTPVMVETGEQSAVATDRPFFRGLQYFGVPSIWRIYPRSGHGWDEPLLVKDAYEQQIAWWDYWLLDRPYPDAQHQAEFDAWKRKRAD